MRILKSHPLLKFVNSYLVDNPQPSNISYLWNFGSLLAFCLVIQIVTGVTLAMHYNPSVAEAFNSVEHIMRDVNNGWMIRYLHSNTASAFFFIVYLHIGRGLYYGSYKSPRTLVWTIGTVIFILMMATAFLGYKRSPKWYKFNKTHYKLRLNTNPSLRYYSTSINKALNSQDSEELKNFIREKNLTPVFIYENLVSDVIKKRIQEETKSLSGVYLILNKITKDYYIGSASNGRFYARFSNHLVNYHGSKILKNAVKKYGLSSFAFIILELFPEKINKDNNKELLDLEDFYLKSLLPNYNILTEAGSSFGYKHTEISRIKMKTNYSEKRRQTIGNLNKGKKLSCETRELIRKAALNREKPIYSNEAVQNMKKKSKAIKIYNLDNTVFGEFSSIISASKILGCGEKTIRRALKSPKNMLKRRWIVKYL